MNFLKKITKKEIFQKVSQIANNQIKSKIKSTISNTFAKEQQKTTSLNKIEDNNQSLSENSQTIDYESAQKFILNLSENSKNIRKHQIERRTKKQVFSQLEIDPIFLQQCQFTQLFKMELQYAQSERYERTQTLHNYLNQVNQTLKKVLLTQNLSIFQVFQIIDRYLNKINQLLAKIKLTRTSIKSLNVQKEHKIKQLMGKKLILKEKIGLLMKMKQKKQIVLIKPQNIEQVYYSQRNRHKLYNRINKMSTQNSYFKLLKSQIISISRSNIRILQETLQEWINGNKVIREKNIEKLFICLYFVKSQSVYKQNSLSINFSKLNKEKLVKEIQSVKQWKNYQYIRDPSMKGKIIDFLNTLIKQIQSLSQ